MILPPLAQLNLNGYDVSTKHRIMNQKLADHIRNHLPERIQLYDYWELVYSLEQHGMSFGTLYANCNPGYQLEKLRKKKEEEGYSDTSAKYINAKYANFEDKPLGYILVIKDEFNNIFGFYLNEKFKPMHQKRYYGNGECFIWKYETRKIISDNVINSQDKSDTKIVSEDKSNIDRKSKNKSINRKSKIKTKSSFKVFKYTGINNNIIYSDFHIIAIGCSDGKSAIWFDDTFESCFSYASDTFGNEILNDSNNSLNAGKSHIAGLEIWRIGAIE